LSDPSTVLNLGPRNLMLGVVTKKQRVNKKL
jgi:hypothetical protein